MQYDIVNFENELAPEAPEHTPVGDKPVTVVHPEVMEDQPLVTEDHQLLTDQLGQKGPLVLGQEGPPVPDPPARVWPRRPTGPRPTSKSGYTGPSSIPTQYRLQQRRNMEDRALPTSGVPEVKVKLSVSAVDSITAFLEKTKKDGTVDPSANVGVRKALSTTGEDAERVIVYGCRRRLGSSENRELASGRQSGDHSLIDVPEEKDAPRRKLRQIQGTPSCGRRH
jgi:hypothetical protein